MFVEAVVFLAATIGVLLALNAFIFHMITRQRKDENNPEQLLDAVADEAMEEINKTSQLILNELNEKYQALLFMYQLMDDKQKEMDEQKVSALLGAAEDSGVLVEISKTAAAMNGEPKAASEFEFVSEPEPEQLAEPATVQQILEQQVYNQQTEKEPPRILTKHPRYGEIKELQEQGLPVEEIARKLSIGKGEVSLIIGLSGR